MTMTDDALCIVGDEMHNFVGFLIKTLINVLNAIIYIFFPGCISTLPPDIASPASTDDRPFILPSSSPYYDCRKTGTDFISIMYGSFVNEPICDEGYQPIYSSFFSLYENHAWTRWTLMFAWVGVAWFLALPKLISYSTQIQRNERVFVAWDNMCTFSAIFNAAWSIVIAINAYFMINVHHFQTPCAPPFDGLRVIQCVLHYLAIAVFEGSHFIIYYASHAWIFNSFCVSFLVLSGCFYKCPSLVSFFFSTHRKMALLFSFLVAGFLDQIASLTSRAFYTGDESLQKDLLVALSVVELNQFFTDGNGGSKRYGRVRPRPNLCEFCVEENASWKKYGNVEKKEFDDDDGNVVEDAQREDRCAVCMTERRSMISVPCGHYNFCSSCVDDLSITQNMNCPICRTVITAYMAVHD